MTTRGITARQTPAAQAPTPSAPGGTLALKDFEPRSMLVVPQTKVERAK